MVNQPPITPGQDSAFLRHLWQEHQAADWPLAGETHEGELMTLDTVIAGCVTYYFEEEALDDQRIGILKDCLDDLETLTPELESRALAYFERLQQIGEILLKLCPHG